MGLNDIGSHFKLTLKICIYDRIYWFHAEQKRPQNKIVIDFFLGVEILIKTWNLISFMKLILNFFVKFYFLNNFPSSVHFIAFNLDKEFFRINIDLSLHITDCNISAPFNCCSLAVFLFCCAIKINCLCFKIFLWALCGHITIYFVPHTTSHSQYSTSFDRRVFYYFPAS